MPGPNAVPGGDKGYKPTGAVRQFRVVTAGTVAETCTEAASAGAAPLGVCQEESTAGDATNGRVVNIRRLGNSRCIAGAALATIGTYVRTDNQGRITALAATTANQNVLGKTTSIATAAGDHVDVDLTIGVQIST